MGSAWCCGGTASRPARKTRQSNLKRTKEEEVVEEEDAEEDAERRRKRSGGAGAVFDIDSHWRGKPKLLNTSERRTCTQPHPLPIVAYSPWNTLLPCILIPRTHVGRFALATATPGVC